WLPKPILRLLLEPRCEAVGARQRDRNELERLTQPLVRLRAREAQEPAAGVTETLAAEARDAEIVVRSLEHEQCEAVARHSEAVADGGDVREYVERCGWIEHVKAVDLVQSFRQQHDLVAELAHRAIPL